MHLPRRGFIPLLVAALIAALPVLPAGAGASPTGAITGSVENHTGRARAVAGQTVTLTAYVREVEAETKTTVTDARGRFAFAVSPDPGRGYVLKVSYKGGEYETPPITFKPGETRKSLTIRVFEPTTDVGVVRVSIHHLILEPGNGVVQVTELMAFVNKTDRTFIGTRVRPDGKRETLRFVLPTGATGVQYLEGLMECCVFATPDGLVDTMDVEPGAREVAFSYVVSYRGRRAAIVRTLGFPTEGVEVFAPERTSLSAAPLLPQQPVTTEQGTFARFSGTGLAAGTSLTVSLAGLPSESAATGRRLLVALFAGLVAAAVAYPLLRRRPSSRVPGRSREELISMIAALDDQFAAGRIDDGEYRSRRTRYKTLLRTLMEQEGRP